MIKEQVAVSGIVAPNLVAVQFHPEKSQAVGLRLLANFLELCGKEPAGDGH